MHISDDSGVCGVRFRTTLRAASFGAAASAAARASAQRVRTISNKKLGLPPAATVHLEHYQKALQKAKLNKPKKAVTLHAFGFAKSSEKK